MFGGNKLAEVSNASPAHYSDWFILQVTICQRRAPPRSREHYCCCCCCCLPDPFRGMGAWRKTMEPQKPGNSPGSGPEVIKRQRVAKE